MLLIISNNELDEETDNICKKFYYHKTPFLRINLDDLYYNDSIVTSKYFIVNNLKYEYSSFSKVWIRRIEIPKSEIINNQNFDFESLIEINSHLETEKKLFTKYFLSRFQKRSMINSLNGYYLDKLEQQSIAKKCNLHIAESFYSNNVKSIDKNINFPIISKPAGNLGYLKAGNDIVSSYTEIVCLDNIPTHFSMSHLQEKINSYYEIRVIYVNGMFFNCGILKPLGKENSVDIKEQTGVRYSPVKIPSETEKKLHDFMSEINFKIGVFDIIKTKENHYYFVEMNACGKFGFYSDICNFDIINKIYTTLSS